MVKNVEKRYKNEKLLPKNHKKIKKIIFIGQTLSHLHQHIMSHSNH